jgi:hypothetical protein
MNWSQRIEVAIWTVFSAAVSAFFSFGGLMFMFVRTLDLHKNSSGEGDFKETEASVILTDILVNWGIALAFICVLACAGYYVTRDIEKTNSASSNHSGVSNFLFGLFAFNLILLCIGPRFGGIAYWVERAPHSPK